MICQRQQRSRDNVCKYDDRSSGRWDRTRISKYVRRPIVYAALLRAWNRHRLMWGWGRIAFRPGRESFNKSYDDWRSHCAPKSYITTNNIQGRIIRAAKLVTTHSICRSRNRPTSQERATGPNTPPRHSLCKKQDKPGLIT